MDTTLDDCTFCRLARGELPARLVLEDEDVLAFHDINPQAPVHVLVIPRRHIAGHRNLEPRHRELVGRLHLAAAEIARRLNIADSGYRTVFNCGDDGGQTVYHLHLHLLGGRRMFWPPWPNAEHVSHG